jgi:hypothetical protein
MADKGRLGAGVHLWIRSVVLVVCASGLADCGPHKPPCATTEQDCGGICRDLTNDVKNCGACGVACGANESCEAAKCECRPTFKRCAGACVDVQTDPANCGACALACSAGDTCLDGQCQCSPPPRAICHAKCVDTGSDPNNCGGCDITCADGFACIGGACVCGSGRAVCKGQCVNVQTDTANCGACGHACTETQICAGGTCQCKEGDTDCDGKCVDTQTDSANCGACGHACPSGQTCHGGVCVCPPDQTDCSGVCVDTQTDPANCGACGNACPPGQSCVGGKCTGGPVTWSGTASEQADLDDGMGNVLHRHASATITWTPLAQDPTGTVFTASGKVVITATGTAGPCTVDLPATTLGVTGTLQFYPTLSPPTYTADGTPTGNNGCLEYTYVCPDGTSQLCGDVKPWLETGQVALPAAANTLSGTTPTRSGISYQWSFQRNPPQ